MGSCCDFNGILRIADYLFTPFDGKVHIILEEPSDEFFPGQRDFCPVCKTLEEMGKKDKEIRDFSRVLKGWHDSEPTVFVVDNTNHGKRDVVTHMLAAVRLPCEQPPVLARAGDK